MIQKPKTQQEWLKDIDQDQNIQDLDNLESTIRNNEQRKWFPSQVIQPGTALGWYNPVTGKYVLGPAPGPTTDARYIVTDSEIITTSADSATLTVPAGHVYKLISALSLNATRVTRMSIYWTPLGGADTYLQGGSGTIPQSYYFPVFGGSYGGAAAATTCALPGKMWLQAGDTVTINQGNFVAADTVLYHFTYEDYEV